MKPRSQVQAPRSSYVQKSVRTMNHSIKRPQPVKVKNKRTVPDSVKSSPLCCVARQRFMPAYSESKSDYFVCSLLSHSLPFPERRVICCQLTCATGRNLTRLLKPFPVRETILAHCKIFWYFAPVRHPDSSGSTSIQEFGIVLFVYCTRTLFQSPFAPFRCHITFISRVSALVCLDLSCFIYFPSPATVLTCFTPVFWAFLTFLTVFNQVYRGV